MKSKCQDYGDARNTTRAPSNMQQLKISLFFVTRKCTSNATLHADESVSSFDFRLEAYVQQSWHNVSLSFLRLTSALTNTALLTTDAPGEPKDVAIDKFDRSSVTLKWKAPNDDGGNPIKGS